MPTSYIASATMNTNGFRVMNQGIEMKIAKAFHLASIELMVYHAEEALAVFNSSSFAATCD